MMGDFLDRYLGEEEKIRRLRTGDLDGGWIWFPLTEYLCGGWADPYNPSSPFRYDPAHDPMRGSVGFYDTGDLLIFTGTIQWDPEGWWFAPPVNPSAPSGGDPNINLDAQRFIEPAVDGLSNGLPFSGTVAADQDKGKRLPYRLRFMDASNMLYPEVVQQGGGVAFFWQFGKAQLAATDDEFGITIGPTGGSGTLVYPRPVDDQGYKHDGIPAGFQLSLNGLILPYDPTTAVTPL